jgi:antitoxin HicB
VSERDSSIEAEIERISSLPYRREYVPNADRTWFARIAEFPGCMTEGDTEAEAAANLKDAMKEWIRAQLESGVSVPPPATSITYSGKFVVRLPPSLHREASACAARENVSLNAFASMAVARAVGESLRVSPTASGDLRSQVQPQVSFLRNDVTANLTQPAPHVLFTGVPIVLVEDCAKS